MQNMVIENLRPLTISQALRQRIMPFISFSNLKATLDNNERFEQKLYTELKYEQKRRRMYKVEPKDQNIVLYDIELPYWHGNLFATKLPSYTLLLDAF